MSKKVILAVVGVFIFLVAVLGFAIFFFWGRVRPVNLTYYGLWEDPQVMDQVISDYQHLHPNVTINYKKQNKINYRERIANALKDSNGPDIVRIHSTWAPTMVALLAPVPADIYSPAQFSSTFYPTAQKDLIVNGKIYALPLEVDGLVLFVNEDLLNQAGLFPVTTWEQLADQAQRLTVRDSKGRINTAGAALVASTNVDHWQEILSLLYFQNKASLYSPSDDAATGALRFYTDFVTKLGVWDEIQENSTGAFAHGKLAYYFGPTWRYFDIKQLSQGGNLHFKMIPVPQLPGKNFQVAGYWAEAVSAKSANQKEAFSFLQYLTSKESATKLYSAQAKTRDFGELYSRVDLASSLLQDSKTGVFIKNADQASSTYLASFTWDGQQGINSRLSKYYADAISAVVKGSDPQRSLETVTSGMAQVFSEYGMTVQ